jgi:hypothetical protein
MWNVCIQSVVLKQRHQQQQQLWHNVFIDEILFFIQLKQQYSDHDEENLIKI